MDLSSCYQRRMWGKDICYRGRVVQKARDEGKLGLKVTSREEKEACFGTITCLPVQFWRRHIHGFRSLFSQLQKTNQIPTEIPPLRVKFPTLETVKSARELHKKTTCLPALRREKGCSFFSLIPFLHCLFSVIFVFCQNGYEQSPLSECTRLSWCI